MPLRSIPLACLVLIPGLARQVAAAASDPPSNTLFVDCDEQEKPKHLLSPVSLSDDKKWRAYVEVDVRTDLGCLHTTRLWIARTDESYRLAYLMPPKRTAAGNGMAILGWRVHSNMLLVRTEQWQYGSDAPDVQQVLAVDASTGLIYEPELEAMLQAHEGKECSFRVTGAGFSAYGGILVRAQLSTVIEPGDTEEDIPPAKRCENEEGTWSFNFDTGEIRRVANTTVLQLYRPTQPDGQ